MNVTYISPHIFVIVVDRIKTFVRSKSNERQHQHNDEIRNNQGVDDESEYLKTIKLRMSRPTRMTVAGVNEEINRINV